MYCMINDLFGDKFSDEKVKYCFNVSALCKNAGISRTYFYKLVNNESVPSLEVAFNICNSLNNLLQEDYQWTVENLWLLK